MRVGRSVGPTQILLRRAARGGSVGRANRVGIAKILKRGSVGGNADNTFNFAPPARESMGHAAYLALLLGSAPFPGAHALLMPLRAGRRLTVWFHVARE